MTRCAPGCGACCAAITCNVTKKNLREQLKEPGCDARNREDYAFILLHWKRINRAEALRRRTTLVYKGGTRFWECDQFDYTTRRCMAYESRPPVCRDYPWYGEGPSAGRTPSDTCCSYWHDVPREQWPEGTIPLTAVE